MNGHLITIGSFLFIAGGTFAVIKFQLKKIEEVLKDRKDEDNELWTGMNKIRENITDIRVRIAKLEK